MKKKLLCLATLALLFTGVASAQTTGSITGVVTDGSTGQPVIGAVVVATSPAAPGEQTAVTDAKGAFTIVNLPAGKYKLQASFEGYKPEQRAELALGENVTLRANLAIVPEAVQLEEVVVTGSRIKRKDLTTSAPVAVLNKEQILASGKVSLGDFLQTLPEQGNALNAQTNNGNDGSVRISLRSLGSNRTLVLVNGRRMVSGGTGADSAPDLNTIPAAAVERIEVLKDGASAVYGSDAIAGVVNVILKKRFDGTEASAYAGTSAKGDATTYDVSVITGTGTEKGNLLFSVGYQDQKPVMAGDRNFSSTLYNYDFSTGEVSASGSSGTLPQAKFKIPSPTTTCAVANIPSLEPTLQDVCTKWIAAGATSAKNSFQWDEATKTYVQKNDSYNTYPTNYLVTPGKRLQVFTSGDTKIGTAARGFFEASYVNRQSAGNLAPQPVTSPDINGTTWAISKDSLYNPFGIDVATWRRRTVEFGNRSYVQDLDTFRVVTGLDGSLGDWAGPLRGWSWNAYYSYGRTQGTDTETGALLWSHIKNALGPSMIDPANGAPICVTTPGDATTAIANCVPADFLHGDNTLTPAMKKYLGYVGTTKGQDRLEVYSASIGGDVVKLLSDRPIAVFGGVDYRKEYGEYIPEVASATRDSTDRGADPTAGGFNVKEYYAELSLPLANGVPGIEDLEASLAARLVDYSNFGTNSTYKIGLRYSPVRDFTLRGTYSTAFRAPNVGELYSSGVTTSADFVPTGDPCAAGNSPNGACGAAANNGDTTSQQFNTLKGSNPDLKPETAKIITAGIVIEPRVIPNFSATLDYYDIKVKKTVAYLGGSYILAACYLNTVSDPTMCARIHRDPSTLQINTIDDKLSNIGELESNGLDLGLRYGLPLASAGHLSMQLDGTYLLAINQVDSSGFKTKGVGNYDLGVNPKFKFNVGAIWSLQNLGVGATLRYIGGFKECDGGSCTIDSSASRNVSAAYPIDVFASYKLKTVAGQTSLAAGVQNLFNEDPPSIYTASNYSSDQNNYSMIGRYYYARLTQSW